MKLEIGGGTRNKGGDWVNLDLLNGDITHDLDVLPWPIPDESVDLIYSSHCIEHLKSHRDFLRQCARIGKLGCQVEIRCPDAMAEMAMVTGHTGVLGVLAFLHADKFFPELYWGDGLDRRLKLTEIIANPDDFWFPKARSQGIFAAYSDQQIMDWVPRTCHERCYHFVVTGTESRGLHKSIV